MNKNKNQIFKNDYLIKDIKKIQKQIKQQKIQFLKIKKQLNKVNKKQIITKTFNKKKQKIYKKKIFFNILIFLTIMILRELYIYNPLSNLFFKNINFTNSKIVNFFLFNSFTNNINQTKLITTDNTIFYFKFPLLAYMTITQIITYSNSNYSMYNDDISFHKLMEIAFFLIFFIMKLEKYNFKILLFLGNTQEKIAIILIAIILSICDIIIFFLLEINNKEGLYRSTDIATLIIFLDLLKQIFIQKKYNIKYSKLIIYFIICFVIILLIEDFLYIKIKCFPINNIFHKINYIYKNKKKRIIHKNVIIKPLTSTNEKTFFINNLIRNFIIKIINIYININNLNHHKINYILSTIIMFSFTIIFNYLNLSPHQINIILINNSHETQENLNKVFIKILLLSFLEQFIKIILINWLNILTNINFLSNLPFLLTLLIRFIKNIKNLHYFYTNNI